MRSLSMEADVTTNAPAIPNSELNVTPMLDVLLVLLIIFMALAIRIHQTIDAQLPQPCVAACEGGSDIVLEVLPRPSFRRAGAAGGPGHLASGIRDVFANRPEKIMHVAGDPHVPYQAVITAMDVARSAGVRVLSVAPTSTRSR